MKKSEDMDEELKESKKSHEVICMYIYVASKWLIRFFRFFAALKSLAERKEKELDRQGQELQELKTNNDGLRKMLRKKEKESEEKDREIASLNQVIIIA